VLARIERVEGVEWAAVEATGRYLAIRAREGSAVEEVATAVGEALGARGRPAGEEPSRSQLAARERGDPWFTAGEAHALSYIEARLVAVRVAGRVGSEIGLTRAQRDALAEAVREDFFRFLERLHAEDVHDANGRFYSEWPRIALAVAERMAAQLPDPAALAERLAACYARPARS
jgi:hypothetical protein